MSVDDRLAILDRIAHYSYAWDGRDSDAYAALFTEDGVFEVYTGGDEPVIHNEGRAAIHAWARSIHTGEDPGLRRHPPGEQTRHNQSGTVFDELGGDHARTRSMLLSARQGPGDAIPVPSTTGVYSDEWRRTREGWRIARRTLRMDIPPAR
ncbi:MAG: nuclear transport factor 2 family protein [Chloroflexi bacterium]|nr:nuclear transport factor 2 family protein [Chloroflexota bacterium]